MATKSTITSARLRSQAERKEILEYGNPNYCIQSPPSPHFISFLVDFSCHLMFFTQSSSMVISGWSPTPLHEVMQACEQGDLCKKREGFMCFRCRVGWFVELRQKPCFTIFYSILFYLYALTFVMLNCLIVPLLSVEFEWCKANFHFMHSLWTIKLFCIWFTCVL